MSETFGNSEEAAEDYDELEEAAVSDDSADDYEETEEQDESEAVGISMGM